MSRRVPHKEADSPTNTPEQLRPSIHLVSVCAVKNRLRGRRGRPEPQTADHPLDAGEAGTNGT